MLADKTKLDRYILPMVASSKENGRPKKSIIAFIKAIISKRRDPVRLMDSENGIFSYWLYVRLSDATALQVEKVRMFVSGVADEGAWNDDESFFIFESYTPRRGVFRALCKVDIAPDDLMVLGEFGEETILINGHLRDTAVLDIIDIN